MATAALRAAVQRLLANGLALTIVADVLFFSLCLLCHACRRRLRRRHAVSDPTPSAAETRRGGSRAEPLLPAEVEGLPSRPSGVDVEGRPLRETAKNYLAFLDTGMWLFVVLSAIALPSTTAVWGPNLILRGESLRSIRRTLFHSSSGCLSGFPEVDPDDLFRCAGGIGGKWKHFNHTGEEDPRPVGPYVLADSLDDCRHEALMCGAPALAFNESAAVDSDAGQHSPGGGQCWLLRAAPSRAVPLDGFVYCIGRQDCVPGKVEFALTLVYGLVAIAFACRLLRALSTSQKSLLESTAVWLTELPCKDREDGEPFLLEERDFGRVANDLREAIELKLTELLKIDNVSSSYLEEQKVEAVCVLHVKGQVVHIIVRHLFLLLEWVLTSERLCVHLAAAVQASRRAAVLSGRPLLRMQPTRAGLDAPLQKSPLAGHAFAVMRREAYVDALLAKRTPLCGLACLSFLPSYVSLQDYTLFKFGVPPWSAVTLRCQRAPPASDIIWTNLHANRKRMRILRAILELLLLIFTLSFVVPVSIAQNIFAVADTLNKGSLGHALGLAPTTRRLLEQAADKLPSYILLMVNSVLLPSLIQLLSDYSKPHLRSRSEVVQFKLNLFYLVLNSFLIPLLGFLTMDKSTVEQGVAYLSKLSQNDTRDALEILGMHTLSAPSELMLKYSANAALVTSGCQLLQLGRLCAQCCLCMPFEPWPFPWGYWYAWSMSVIVVSLAMGVLMPTQLLLAALFFFLLRRVHKECLKTGVFEIKFDMDAAAEISIACWMLRSVSIFWILMGLFFFSQPHDSGDVMITLSVLQLPKGCDTFVFPGTNLHVPVQLAIFGALLSSSVGVWLLTYPMSNGGSLERQIWRRVGEGGHAFVVCCVEFAALALLVGAFANGTGLQRTQIEAPLHNMFAVALWLFALLVAAAAALTRHILTRKAKHKNGADIQGLLEGGRALQLDRLLAEENMEGMEGLVRQGGSFGRMMSCAM